MTEGEVDGMRILLVNDDGFDSPWLRILARACSERGHETAVCAPDTEQSARSQSFAIHTALEAMEDAMEGTFSAWRVRGTPADSVRLGIMELPGGQWDMVISGINRGYNVGLAVYVSGTAGAAREAAFQGIPALALSAEVGTPEETVRWFAREGVAIGEEMVRVEKTPLTFWNVNCPPLPREEIRGRAWGPLSSAVYRDGYERRVSPRGQVYFWLLPEEKNRHPEEGSDLGLVSRGYISMTRLTPELGSGPA